MKLCIFYFSMAASTCAVSTPILAQQGTAPEIETVKINPRLWTFKNFPDGLHTGARDVHIYLPPNYQSSRDTYPVFYFHDGHQVFSGITESPEASAQADIAHDRLVAQDLIYPAILVGITAGSADRGGNRGRDLSTRAGEDGIPGVEKYYQFIAHELKPYIDRNFRTRPEPRWTATVGYSLGGSAAFYMGYRHPETFGLVGCLSPSLWQRNAHLVSEVEADTTPRTPAKFWMDAGQLDLAGIEVVTPRATRALIRRGWREGQDVAFQLGYGHGHDLESNRARLPAMFLFLAGKTQLRPRGLTLKPMADIHARALDLGQVGESNLVWPEVRYDHDFYINPVNLALSVANGAVAKVDSHEPQRVHATGPGSTTATTSYYGLTASIKVIGYNTQTYERYPAPHTATPLHTDLLPAFELLPHEIQTPANSASARFMVSYDDQFVYIVVKVRDSQVISRSGRRTSEQDGIEIRFDARADPARSEARNPSEAVVLRIGLAPGPERTKPVLYPPMTKAQEGRPPWETGGSTWNELIPAGTRAECYSTADGYESLVAIPTEYLNKNQNGAWKQFRLNITVNSVETANSPVVRSHWQPAWNSADNRVASGTFQRSEP